MENLPNNLGHGPHMGTSLSNCMASNPHTIANGPPDRATPEVVRSL